MWGREPPPVATKNLAMDMIFRAVPLSVEASSASSMPEALPAWPSMSASPVRCFEAARGCGPLPGFRFGLVPTISLPPFGIFDTSLFEMRFVFFIAGSYWYSRSYM